MPKPTMAALKRRPQAVVILQSPLANLGEIVYDYEWFETTEARNDWWKVATDFARQDAADHGDLVHVLANISATDPLTIDDVEVLGVNLPDGWADQRVAEIKADPTLVVAPAPVRQPKAVQPDVPKAPKGAQVKGRKKSPAAAVIGADQGDAQEAPKPKSVRVKAQVAAKAAAENADAPGDQVEAPKVAPKAAEARKAALKARLQANAEDAGMALIR